MQYSPPVESMRSVARVKIDVDRYALLCDEVKASGNVQYTFLCCAFRRNEEHPEYIVSSEVNSTASTLGGGSHFLGVFSESGHATLNNSDAWSDRDTFFAEALRHLSLHYRVPLDVLRSRAKLAASDA
jgi:hypothetical protein